MIVALTLASLASVAVFGQQNSTNSSNQTSQPSGSGSGATAVCNPDICLNHTVAAANGMPNASYIYDKCVADAGSTNAFICRCTPRLYECFANTTYGGGCSADDSKSACFAYVIDQALGCSQKLCKASAMSTAGVLFAVGAAIVTTLM